MQLRESARQMLSFEWSHFGISSTVSKVRTTMHSGVNSTTEKYCSVAFMSMVTLQDFIHRLKSQNHDVQRSKQHNRKALLGSFNWNGHAMTSGFLHRFNFLTALIQWTRYDFRISSQIQLLNSFNSMVTL